MIREYHLSCPTGECGLDIKISQPSRALRMHCNKCKRLLFPNNKRQSQTGVSRSSEEETAASSPSSSASSFSSPAPSKTSEGLQHIDRYQVMSKIGEGGMGNVYLCLDQETQEKIVIKVLNIGVFKPAERERVMDYFIREAQVLLELNHPNIVSFKGCGNLSGSPYYVMEYIEGEELKKTIKNGGPMKVSQAISIVYHLASALEYGLKFKLIHRDIKPANIMLLAKNNMLPKLIDFGLAKNLGEHSSSLTQEGTMMGTPFYMPKEQIFDAKNADHRSDVYALGATFYYMLAGRAPYEEFASQGSIAVMDAIVNNKLTPLKELRPNLHPRIYEIISKAMASEREQRYSSATELKRDLADFIKSVKK